MPQFNPEFFAPQIIWLVISFAVLYLLMSRWALPGVSQVLGMREERIQANLEKAEKLKAEAEAVLANYEKAIADARAEAHAALGKTAQAITALQAEREGAFAKKLAAQMADAEARIQAAKRQAMADVTVIAADLASAMTAKLTGASPARERIEAAIAASVKEQA